MDVDPSCSQDQVEDKWASVMLSPFSRKHTPLKFDVHFDEREVFVSSSQYAGTNHMSVSDSQGEEKMQYSASRQTGPGVPRGTCNVLAFLLLKG